MDRKGKGKQIAGNGSSTGGNKRKGVEFRDEGLRINKRKNRGAVQFFEESAEVGYFGGSSDEEEDDDGLGFLNDMEEDEPEVEASGKGDQGRKSSSTYVFPKEEEINEEEFDRIMEERYKPGSGSVRYADDDVKDSIEMDALVPTSKDPPIWKVKCAIGRERHSVLCLMHKFVELRKIGTKLQILSVFSVEHVKGCIFIEADKEHCVLEACKGLTGIYSGRMVLLPKAEAPNLLSVERKSKKISNGKWARVKSGKYKGDLAQVVAVSDSRRKALIKLIPRIDIQALTQKYGGGVSVQKGPAPPPRLISSSELEEFRPLIQVRRDRDTGITFEHLDSLMLKDGYLYKKVSLDSLDAWGVMPSKEEILKFTPVERKETGDEEWISEIYGEEKKKKILPTGKGGGKGEGLGSGKGEGSGGGKEDGSSGSKSESSFELYNLVCFSRKDFGLIVGVDDKGDGFKVLKEGSDGPAVVTVGKKEMQSGPFNSKFTALDVNNRQISVNDIVKISKGPSEGKQGVVRQIYRGVMFLYDESEEENGGYFCCKSQSCEKVKLFSEETSEKADGFDASAFGDASSPKSPLSPEKEWQPRKKYINSNEGDKGSMYSIGQKLRIRVGPLKGYLCRVIALRYSDVTVKLDSQHKVFTVKSEHLAEVRDRNIVLNTTGDAGTGSFQHFDVLGTEGSSGDWAKGAGTSGDGGSWNAGGASTDWNSWGSKPTPDASSQQQTVQDDNTSAWANETETTPASGGDQPVGWNSWDKKPAPEAVTGGSWGDAGASKVEASSWGKQGASTSNAEDLTAWGKQGGSSDGNKQEDSRWGKLVEDYESSKKKEEISWGKKAESESGFGKGDGESSWGNKGGNSSASNKEVVSWGQQDRGSDRSIGGSAWGNSSGEKKDNSSGWNKSEEDQKANSQGASGWGKPDGGSSWTKQDGGASWGKTDDGGSSWGKKDDGGASWGQKNDGNKDDGGSPWAKKNDGGSSWAKKDGGSAWGKNDGGGSVWGPKNDGNKDEGGSPWAKKNDGGSSWAKKDEGGSAWGKNDGGGSAWGPKNDSNKDDGGSSWGKKNDEGSSWAKKEDGGSTWGKNDGGASAWNKKDDGGGSSWGKQNNSEDSTWSKPGGGSSWSRQDSNGGGSSWSKQNDGGDGSSWSNQGGGAGRGFGGRGGGGRGGGGGGCFKCGETGHMARECPQGGGGRGGGGGGACFKCGEAGHMARDCPQGGGGGGGRGGGGGGACFKCNEPGHMARDCPQGGGGGRGGGGGGACFKCGESGHMARECPQGGGGGGGGGRYGGGGGGGGSCYKCGESGHFARECTSSGGR